MANEATAQTSCIQEIHEADECRENIPPGGATAAAGISKLKVQGGDVEGYSSPQPSGENKPLSDMCTFAASASSKGGVQANSRIAGLQSALTPILKYLNIGMKRPSPEPLKHRNSPRRTVPFFSFGNTTANCQKSTGSASQHPNSDSSTSHSGRSLGDTDAPVHWLDDEYFPEITLLDVTCDSTMQLTSNGLALPDNVPVTPVSAREFVRRPEQVADMNPNSKMSSTLTPKMEISYGLLPGGEIPSLEVTQDISPVDSVLENSRPSLELSGQNVAKIQTPVEDTLATHPANVTCDINSSGDMSAQCAASQFSSSDMQCNTSSKNVTSELPVEPVETTDPVDANHEELLTSHDAELTSKVTQPILKTARSVNSTFTALQPSQLSTSTDLNTTAQMSCPQNKTLDLPPSSVSIPTAESEATGQACSVSKNFGNTTANCQKSTRSASQHPNSDSSTSHSGRSLGDTDPPVRWLDNEYFPEITLLDVTCDSAMQLTSNGLALPDNVPVTPVSAREFVRRPEQVADMNPNSKMSSTLTPKMEISSVLLPGGEIPYLEVTQDSSPVDSLKNNRLSSELCGQIMAETGRLDRIQSSTEELSSTLNGIVTHTISLLSEQSDKCAGENTIKACLEVTRDISMDSVLENSRPSLELSGQNVAKIQTPVENTLATHPANVTCDINSSVDMSAQSAASQFSTSDMQCNTSSKNVTSELPVEPGETTDPVEANNEELLTSHDAELTSKMTQPILKTAVNSTFTALQPSQLSTSTDLNTTAQMFCPQNKTLDLPTSNVSIPTAESEATGQACSVSKNTTEPSFDMNQNCAAVKASGSSDVQNATFDRHSLQKSSGNTILGEAGAATFCLQNNTFDSKPLPKQNGTITFSETSLSDSHQNTLDKPSPHKVCNATTSPKNKSEIHPPELLNHSGTPAGTDTNAKMVDPPESTFEANPATEVASGAGRCETKDHSPSGLPMTDGFSDSLGHQSMHTDNNKADTFNLDDTLDLRSDYMITSTPMTNCKTVNLNIERDEGKTIAAQKKLYGDGPSKPVGQVLPDVPSNIVCDRKTFLTQPAAKSILPPSKASQLLKYKPTSILPGRFELSGLPMTRQRAQVEALRNTAASDAPQETTGISSSYNLRAATTGSQQPNSGLRKTQLSGIPSGIQRFAPGLRPPSARCNAPASSSTDKLRGPTATNPVTKTSQTKKHLLTRGETLPSAKKKKMMDALVSSSCAEASTSSCNAANRAKNLKQPTTGQRAFPSRTQRDDAAVPASTAENSTSCDAASRTKNLKQPATSQRAMLAKAQAHGCVNCIVLEREIQRLKEELLKYSKQEEEC